MANVSHLVTLWWTGARAGVSPVECRTKDISPGSPAERRLSGARSRQVSRSPFLGVCNPWMVAAVSLVDPGDRAHSTIRSESTIELGSFEGRAGKEGKMKRLGTVRITSFYHPAIPSSRGAMTPRPTRPDQGLSTACQHGSLDRSAVRTVAPNMVRGCDRAAATKRSKQIVRCFPWHGS